MSLPIHEVYLVKHHSAECYAADNGLPPQMTHDKQKAFRFGTIALAEICKSHMAISIAWDVVKVRFQDGKVLDD